jgi:hypothetical protein
MWRRVLVKLAEAWAVGLLLASLAAGFSITPLPPPLPAPMTERVSTTMFISQNSIPSPLQQGIDHFISQSPSVLVAAKPTAEEIAAKRLNFNIVFWGGGFVAPLVATVFYFGWRFWEK